MDVTTQHLPRRVMDISVQLEMSRLTAMPAVVWSTATHVGQQQRVYQFLVSLAAHPCAHASGGGARIVA
jgi:hypothetical protein